MRNVIKLTLIIFFLNICIAKSGIVKPKSKIAPAEVIKIQLQSLKKNDKSLKKQFQFLTDTVLSLSGSISGNCYSAIYIFDIKKVVVGGLKYIQKYS